MKTDLTFEEVRKFVEDDSPEVIKDLDAILNLLVLFSPLLFATPQTAVLAAIGTLSDLLGVKDGIVQIGERIYRKVTSRAEEGPTERLARMRAAYGLICFTSFFDALNETLPELMKAIELKPTEKITLSNVALAEIEGQDGEVVEVSRWDILATPLSLPHPAKSFEAQREQLLPLYSKLADGFLAFLESLAVWDEMSRNDQRRVKQAVSEIAGQALEKYQAQYFSLATKYEEFFVWASLSEHQKTQSALEDLPERMQRYFLLASEKAVDVGMSKLTDLASSLPATVSSYQAHQAIKELPSLYRSQIESPVVEDLQDGDSVEPTLSYPKKSEIFIPQHFQTLIYSGKSLEDESTWETMETREDLEAFLVSYLSSPYSANSPLIILGHPGSGKSLLTSILAARLIDSPYAPIRVSLRSVKADNDISTQIEEQLRSDTKRDIKWAELTEELAEHNPLVLLDGYDELLQASGRVFSGYVQSAQRFQENELSLGRGPVRTIITSRITLIDKADIPHGATVLRLQPFNETQRSIWSNIWNKINRNYFQHKGVDEFSVPNRRGLIDLAEQPLLLLMLAIYDSESNQLRKQSDLEQTLLYDSLLRRFILRERRKSAEFLHLDPTDRHELIDKDLDKLATAAIGMFNRRSLHIMVRQLDRDLRYFQPENDSGSSVGATLTQAELLLGSFFFVHESASQHKSAESTRADTSFEFLHNTFGEFLAAEFMLQRVMKVCKNLSRLQKNDMLDLYHEELNRPDTFPAVCFAYAPLHARPVIIEMMREWLKHVLKRNDIEPGEFAFQLDALIIKQLSALLTSNKMPQILTGTSEDNPFDKLPTLGHIALYSLNLIVLAAALSPHGYRFSEEKVLPSQDGQRAWDRLTHIWRSWFSLENLSGLASIMDATREKEVVTVRIRDKFAEDATVGRGLDVVHSVASTLADDRLAGLTGYFLADGDLVSASNALFASSYRLNLEGIDLDAEFQERLARLSIQRGWITDAEQNQRVFDPILHNTPIGTPIRHGPVDLLMHAIKQAQHLDDPRYARRLYERAIRGRDPRNLPTDVIAEIIGLAQQFGDDSYASDIYEGEIRRRDPRSLPISTLVEIARLAEQFGDERYVKDIYAGEIRRRDPRTIPENALVEIIHLAEQFGDERYTRDIYEEGIRRRDPRLLTVDALIEAIRLASRFGDERYARDIYEEEIRRRDPRLLTVDALVEAIRLASRFGDERYARELLERALLREPPHQLSLGLGDKAFPQQNRVELPVGLAAEAIQLARQFGHEGYAIDIYRDAIRTRDPRGLSDDLLVELIRLTQQFDDESYARDIYERALVGRDPRSLPDGLLVGAIRLAIQFGDDSYEEAARDALGI